MVSNLREKIDIDFENIEKTLFQVDSIFQRKQIENIELTALGGYLQNVYRAMENIIYLLLKDKEVKLTKDDKWHSKIIELAVKNSVISKELAEQLKKYLKFRHKYIHGYGIDLDETLLLPLAREIKPFWFKFKNEIEKYIRMGMGKRSSPLRVPKVRDNPRNDTR